MEPFELACLILDRSALSGDELVGAASDDERDFLDRYELLEKAGSGVSGEVFRARDRSLERIVAVKRIPCSPALGKTREAAARLRRELLALVTLAHEGIPSIYDAKWTARYVYVVMEFVAGTSLARALEERRLSLAERVAVVEEVARIVHFAHERGFVHRDLKPSNILLGSDGRPRVVDFGVAKNVDDDARLTSTGAFLGTVQFMSPEQASGRSKDVDARSDVFSLGAILFAALAGRPPFE
ncbi:serine/threonine protein kinase [bacterium]|nr:serine/threonine protein kinase [bacterium]